MAFDSIPEDREEVYECPRCGGDVTLQDNGKWECNNCSYPNMNTFENSLQSQPIFQECTLWTEKGRNPDRIREMCEILKTAWERVPDQRFGQFLLNYIFEKKMVHDSVPAMKGTSDGMMPDRTNSIMFNQEDDVTFALIEVFAHDGINCTRAVKKGD